MGKKSKHAHKMSKNCQKAKENLENHEFSSVHLKPNLLQSQLNFAPLHNGETVTFRNFGISMQ